MLHLTCLERLKDKRGMIYGYTVQDKQTGKTANVKPQDLKLKMATKVCDCDNLTLTSDFRLIPTHLDQDIFNIK